MSPYLPVAILVPLEVQYCELLALSRLAMRSFSEASSAADASRRLRGRPVAIFVHRVRSRAPSAASLILLMRPLAWRNFSSPLPTWSGNPVRLPIVRIWWKDTICAHCALRAVFRVVHSTATVDLLLGMTANATIVMVFALAPPFVVAPILLLTVLVCSPPSVARTWLFFRRSLPYFFADLATARACLADMLP